MIICPEAYTIVVTASQAVLVETNSVMWRSFKLDAKIMNFSGKVMCFCVETCTFSVEKNLVKDFAGRDKMAIILYKGIIVQ